MHNNEPDLICTALRISYGVLEKKNLPAAPHPFSHTDHGSNPAFYIQMTPRPCVCAHTICYVLIVQLAEKHICIAGLSTKSLP